MQSNIQLACLEGKDMTDLASMQTYHRKKGREGEGEGEREKHKTHKTKNKTHCAKNEEHYPSCFLLKKTLKILNNLIKSKFKYEINKG